MPTGRPSEVIRALERLGWEQLRQTGSHVILGRGGARIPVPNHRRDLKTGTFASIARRAGLTAQELADLL
jgi:predicted RNA binding protein YcfA (HicA-like mRNA interferase family)